MQQLTINTISDYIFHQKKIVLSPVELEGVHKCYLFLSEFQIGKIVYGINTGFGPMAQYRINAHDLNQLQYNIIRSHSCGAGEPLSHEAVRATMLARLYTFLAGKSGVHPDVIHILVAFINHDICPLIPQHGSVGASGDLVQLAHMALTMIGEGEVFYKGKRIPAKEAMQECGIVPLTMHIREGLAITNGTSVMTGIGLINVIRAKKLIKWSILASVLVNEIASSYDDFMSEILNGLKLHKGQREVAAMMRKIVSSSKCLLKREQVLYNGKENGEDTFKHKVQPYYSLRCVPQILGPVWDTIMYTEEVLLNEFHSVDDNPVVDPQSNNIYHGGNFHGDYVSFEMDKLKIAVTKMTMLVERQLNYLCHDKINEILPPFVNLGVLGLNYGMQAVQFTATSTTAECQTLSNPMYIHSIPNNNDNQDVVSMGTNSALLTQKVIENGYQVMAIEIMALVQAIDSLGIQDKLSEMSKKLYTDIRNMIPTFIKDEPKYKELEQIIVFLQNTDNYR
ncbi:MAG: aromatic amino acid ammonia-lyase [Bacteroidales bacterium]